MASTRTIQNAVVWYTASAAQYPAATVRSVTSMARKVLAASMIPADLRRTEQL